MASPNEGWDAQKILDLYIHDYMVKKNMPEAAATFAEETGIGLNPVAIDTREGFLTEWFSIFWDVYNHLIQQNPRVQAGSSVQANNVMENPQTNVYHAMPRSDVNQQLGPLPPQLAPQLTPQLGLRLTPQLVQQLAQQFGPQLAHQWPQQLSQRLAPRFPNGANFENNVGLPASLLLAEQHIPPPRDLNANVQRFNVDQLARAHASSSNASHHPPLTNTLQQRTHRVNRQGTNLGMSINSSSTSHGVGGAINLLTASINAGRNIGIYTSPSNELRINEVGSSSFGTGRNILNSPSEAPQQEELHTSATYHQPDGWDNRRRKSLSTTLDGENDFGGDNAEADKPLDKDVEIFLSQDDETVADSMSNLVSTLQCSSDYNNNRVKAFSFQEVSSFHSSEGKVLCCHFASDGKYLAGAGHDKKVMIWNMDSLSHVCTADSHTNIITDVRFQPNSTVFATSSFDRTVQIWDAANISKPTIKLQRHADQVMSVDFHTRKPDLLCSCDCNAEIRLWDINQSACIRVFQGANRKVRFQPEIGNLLAAVAGNKITLFDVETNTPQYYLEGHVKDIRSICWDPSGKFLASVSEDNARMWSIISGGKCIYDMHSHGDKLESCTFHPGYTQLVVIGSYKSLQLWNPIQNNRTLSIQAHNGMIASLTGNPHTELVASASHDRCVKIWR